MSTPSLDIELRVLMTDLIFALNLSAVHGSVYYSSAGEFKIIFNLAKLDIM